MNYNQICEFVLLERKRQKLTQQELADKAKVSRGTISNIERNKMVYYDSVEVVLKSLGCNLELKREEN